MNENSVKELIDSFIEYRNLISPLQDALLSVSKTYEEIRKDLDTLAKSFSGSAVNQLEKVPATINAQAKSGQELGRRIEEYAESGEKYAQAVKDMSARFSEVSRSIGSLDEIEKNAQDQLERIDTLIEEKRTTYNLKELQRSLDGYNKNIERISDFINKDIAAVLKQNADKIESIRKENEQLSLYTVILSIESSYSARILRALYKYSKESTGNLPRQKSRHGAVAFKLSNAFKSSSFMTCSSFSSIGISIFQRSRFTLLFALDSDLSVRRPSVESVKQIFLVYGAALDQGL